MVAIATLAPHHSPTPSPLTRSPLKPSSVASTQAPASSAGRWVWAWLAVVAVAASAVLASMSPLPAPGAPASMDVHVVEPGETMWSIASAVAPAGEAAGYVERLVATNGSAVVAPGQAILLPRR